MGTTLDPVFIGKGFLSCNCKIIASLLIPPHDGRMNEKKNPNNQPSQPRKPEPTPEWIPKDPPVQEPPSPKVPEIAPPPTEDPAQDPGTPPPDQ